MVAGMTATLPFRLDANLTTPDGRVFQKARVVHRTDGLLTAIVLGDVVLQTYVDGEVTMDGKVFVVPTPQGAMRFEPMADCGCGG